MIKNVNIRLILTMTVIVTFAYSNTDFNGQFSGWGRVSKENSSFYKSFGMRYLPEFYFQLPAVSDRLDIEMSFNLYTSTVGKSNSSGTNNLNAKFYRAWVRYSTTQTDLRVGLQRINFGPARLLRSLRWFDQLDPRDPLQLTTGVWGLRYKYDFSNNSNLWLWGLYGGKSKKCFEIAPTKKNTAEFGGRIQNPVHNGEIGFTVHFREADLTNLMDDRELKNPFTNEQRLGIDGIFDIGVGFWFESILIHAENDIELPDWSNFLTLGIDYTFGIGNGITCTFEHLSFSMDDNPYGFHDPVQLSAALCSYPVSWLDQISLMPIYQWNNDQLYLFFSWQRTYDSWTIHASLFGNLFSQEKTDINISGTSFDTNGVQMMLIFNH